MTGHWGNYRPDLVSAEDPSCPADLHAPTYRSWVRGKRRCVCPSTLAAVAANNRRRRDYDRTRRASAIAAERREADAGPLDLSKADTFDADSFLWGYPVKPYRYGSSEGISVHTEALIVLRMAQQRHRACLIAEAISKTPRTVVRIKGQLRAMGYDLPEPLKPWEETGWRNDPYLSWRYAT